MTPSIESKDNLSFTSGNFQQSKCTNVIFEKQPDSKTKNLKKLKM
jgi:hypothetical protein